MYAQQEARGVPEGKGGDSVTVNPPPANCQRSVNNCQVDVRPCSCGHVDPAPTFIAIQEDHGVPLLALFNCRACNSTRAIPWADCTAGQRREAIRAQLSRDHLSEMMMPREG
jgi:hypothetical protein